MQLRAYVIKLHLRRACPNKRGEATLPCPWCRVKQLRRRTTQQRREHRVPGCSKTRSSSRVSTSCSRSQLTYTPTRLLEPNALDASSRCTTRRPAARTAQLSLRVAQGMHRCVYALSSSNAFLSMARSVARIARRAASFCARSSAARGSTAAAQRLSVARRCAGCAAMRVRRASTTPRISQDSECLCSDPALQNTEIPTAPQPRTGVAPRSLAYAARQAERVSELEQESSGAALRQLWGPGETLAAAKKSRLCDQNAFAPEPLCGCFDVEWTLAPEAVGGAAGASLRAAGCCPQCARDNSRFALSPPRTARRCPRRFRSPHRGALLGALGGCPLEGNASC